MSVTPSATLFPHTVTITDPGVAVDAAAAPAPDLSSAAFSAIAASVQLYSPPSREGSDPIAAGRPQNVITYRIYTPVDVSTVKPGWVVKWDQKSLSMVVRAVSDQGGRGVAWRIDGDAIG